MIEYLLVDADGHYYEPDDCFSRHHVANSGYNPCWGPLPARPREMLRQHLWVSPFPEDDVVGLIDLLGPDHVLFGSDYPHPEGLREPLDFVPLLDGCDPVTTRKVLRGNTAGLLGLPDHAPMAQPA